VNSLLGSSQKRDLFRVIGKEGGTEVENPTGRLRGINWTISEEKVK
jgi:hypothetical protein